MNFFLLVNFGGAKSSGEVEVCQLRNRSGWR